MCSSLTDNTPVKTDLAVLVANISNSIGLYDELGDMEAYNRIKECQELLTGTTEKNNGKVYRKYGDTIICGFPDANDAVCAAIGMQEILDQVGKDSDWGIYIHTGIYFGELISNGQEIYGEAVNAAARISDLADAGQTFTSKLTVDLLSSGSGARPVYVDRVSIKGKKEELDIYEIKKSSEETF